MAAKKREQFFIMHSECGSDDQLVPFDDMILHPAIAEARGEAEEQAAKRANNGDPAGAYVIAKLIERGRLSGIEWK